MHYALRILFLGLAHMCDRRADLHSCGRGCDCVLCQHPGLPKDALQISSVTLRKLDATNDACSLPSQAMQLLGMGSQVQEIFSTMQVGRPSQCWMPKT